MALSDEINRMILKIVESLEITSANPTHINTVIQANEQDKPDLEAIISKNIATKATSKQQQKNNKLLKKVEVWDKGPIGKINQFTSEQISNLQGFVANPAAFVFSAFLKKFTKGLGVIALALIIFEAVKSIIDELLKPGRSLDIRFKRDIRGEIIAFRKREDQQKLKQGFSNIIITTQPRLRVGQNQVVNTFDLVRSGNFPDNIGMSTTLLVASGQPLGKSIGRSRFGGLIP